MLGRQASSDVIHLVAERDYRVSKRTTRPENLYSLTQRRLPSAARRLGQRGP